MATGDQSDMVGRLRAALPSQWFPLTAPGSTSATPFLDGILAGFASVWAWLYGLISYANLQTRLATTTDVWLDLLSLDFLGTTLPREVNEGDGPYRARIKAAILQPRGTRAALVQVLTTLTGHAPTVFEPANTSDTGGYTIGGIGYGVGGGYGDLQLNNQFFVTAFRPTGSGVANVAGYANIASFPYGAGGYGVGAIEYADVALIAGQVTDATIQAAIANVIPAGTIAWMNFNTAGNGGVAPLDNFILDLNILE